MEGDRQEKKGMELARDIAWRALAAADPQAIAGRSGAAWSDAEQAWRLPYLSLPVTVSLASHSVTAEPSVTLMEEVLILRYLCHCDGSVPDGHWISFREMPGGRLYFGPFWGRTGAPLAARFAHEPEAFAAAARQYGGEALGFGDASYLFRLLPHFWLGIVLYVGDDEFPAEVSIMFDDSVRQQFTTEDCAAAAQVLCRRLSRASAADLRPGPKT
jgi:hypothetical protein